MIYNNNYKPKGPKDLKVETWLIQYLGDWKLGQ